MNFAKFKRDLSQVRVRKAVRMANNTTQVQEVAGREAIRALYPMKTSGDSARDRDVYHKVTYPAAGTSQIVCFNEAVGQNGIKLDTTNMEKAGQFAKGKDQMVEGYDIIPIPKAATEANRLADIQALLNTGRLALVDENGEVIHSVFPLRRLVSDFSLCGIDTTHGNAPQREPYMLTNPVNIEEGQTFAVNLDFPGVAPVLTADVDLIVTILGQEHRVKIER